ncbi:hypothetical protein FEM48_Zijuj05G0102300 [Ziziphus jujuba var. spinosa]|uniref:Uncharacterized protein n=1 Tax=Ziziphus jujuba var. spinosa TaxID=714518 RepID=A0A978VED2_ZIZJJ|nr:hypothetical protein FEM48_Zijuj05G0102300 [Ziziphus jujuba var. spinosa]
MGLTSLLRSFIAVFLVAAMLALQLGMVNSDMNIRKLRDGGPSNSPSPHRASSFHHGR